MDASRPTSLWGSRSLEVDEVDGVPLFYVDTGQTPFALLTFRHGWVDSTLPTHGWLHLLEHLAMHGHHESRLESNASVGLWTTEFHVTGEIEEVRSFLYELCTWLSHPRFGALEHERAVLEAESYQRSPSEPAHHLDLRFGPFGAGLAAYPELGLHAATPDDLTELAGRAFAGGNAALALNCPPPAGLELPLPSGPRWEGSAAVHAVDGLPAHSASLGGFVTTSGLITDPQLAHLTAEILAAELARTLRHEQRASYGTTPSVERIGPDRLVVALASDVVPDRSPDAVRLVCDVIDRLVEQGVSERSLGEARRRGARLLSDDPTGLWQAASGAHAALRGAPATTAEERLARIAEVDAAEIDAEVRRFAASMLVTSPAGEASRDAPIPYVSGVTPVTRPGTGTRYRSRNAPADPSVLVISDDVCGAWARETGHGVPLAGAAALLAFPDGARTVVSREGTTFSLEPRLWRRGTDAVARLDGLLPPDVLIPMGPRDDGAIPPHLTVGRRLRAQLARPERPTRPVFFVLAGILVTLAAAMMIVTQDLSGALYAALLAVIVVAEFVRRR